MGDPGALYRMQIGAFVRERLLKTPNAFKLPAQGLDIFVRPRLPDAPRNAPTSSL